MSEDKPEQSPIKVSDLNKQTYTFINGAPVEYFVLGTSDKKVINPELQKALLLGLISVNKHAFVGVYHPDKTELVFSCSKLASHTRLDDSTQSARSNCKIFNNSFIDPQTRISRGELVIVQKKYNSQEIEDIVGVLSANWPKGNTPYERYLLNTYRIRVRALKEDGQEEERLISPPLQKTFPTN